MPLCAACGLPSTKICGRCRGARYCSARCQMRDWRARHSRECSNLAGNVLALPFETLYEICLRLDGRGLAATSATCRAFRDAAHRAKRSWRLPRSGPPTREIAHGLKKVSGEFVVGGKIVVVGEKEDAIVEIDVERGATRRIERRARVIAEFGDMIAASSSAIVSILDGDWNEKVCWEAIHGLPVRAMCAIGDLLITTSGAFIDMRNASGESRGVIETDCETIESAIACGSRLAVVGYKSGYGHRLSIWDVVTETGRLWKMSRGIGLSICYFGSTLAAGDSIELHMHDFARSIDTRIVKQSHIGDRSRPILAARGTLLSITRSEETLYILEDGRVIGCARHEGCRVGGAHLLLIPAGAVAAVPEKLLVWESV